MTESQVEVERVNVTTPRSGRLDWAMTKEKNLQGLFGMSVTVGYMKCYY